MADTNPTKNYEKDADDQSLQTVAYMFAGLAMMLNIRLSYSAAPYALLRFKLPENLFSVFVRTTSSALELWCIPSMLLGNIMEQFFINTQDEPSNHYLGFKHEASDLQDKAGTLKGTATTQSEIELASTYLTDLDNDNNAETKLEAKARDLAGKAKTLHEEAGKITDPPELNYHATRLKEAAKNDSKSGLHQKAEELEQAAKRPGDASGQANQVIQAFETVEKNYNKLMAEYKKILEKKEMTTKLSSEDKDKVTDVVKAYLDVKNTYYQMLITYRIKKKANTEIGDGIGDGMILHKAIELYSAANKLAEAPELKAPEGQQDQDPHKELKEQLRGLATKLKAAVGDTGLQQALSELKKAAEPNQAEQIVTNALDVITKYKKVEGAYEKVKERESDYTKLANDKYGPVKEAFNALEEKFSPLKKSIENVLKLRVQELANKSEDLSKKAGALDISDLREKATQLANAASESSTGLQQKALLLVAAINSDTKVTTQAIDVIQQFEEVTDKYKELAKLQKYKQLLKSALEKQGQTLSSEEENVKEVYEAYNDLNTLYNKILNFTKVKHYSEQLNNAATPSSVNARNAIKYFNSLVDSYDKLGDNKSIVQSQLENLKSVYSDAVYFYKKCVLAWPSIITNWLNFLTFVILLIIYVTGGDNGHVTGYYWIMAISGFVFGINMVLVYAVDYRYLAFYMAGENSFPMVTSLILYFATSIFGNRRKYNSDFLVVLIDISIAILIALVASVLWTVAFYKYKTPIGGGGTPDWPQIISPIAMVIVGMGLVYSIYPGIAPGMIVPFYLIDKIEMVLLIATAFPPIIIAFLRKYKPSWSPQTDFLLQNFKFKFGGWTEYRADKPDSGWPVKEGDSVHGWIWHFFDILIPLQISLAVIFIYSLHYRDSSIARSIINQPKMSTFLSIIFYMCHEILLALGFPGMVGNNGAGGAVLLPVQYVGALLMVFLAFYSIGYITEYKKHDPCSWPTEGMTKWNALCYWLKMASKITNKNFKQLFTTDSRRDLLIILFKCVNWVNRKSKLIAYIL
uniref:Theileria-specific sub-telomeric protein, putative n=1 Tax=Theileria annulata TaxID=5874 RepID=A0A3B0MXA8_THEAN